MVLVRPDKKRVARWIVVLCVIIGLMEVSLPQLQYWWIHQQREEMTQRWIALDNESKAYADSAIHAIVSTWSEKDLLERASPEFKQSVTTDQLDRLFRSFSGLGSLQYCEPAQGRARPDPTKQRDVVILGLYTAKATFEKGEASIKLVLIQHKPGDQWQILSFHVDSPALVPPP